MNFLSTLPKNLCIKRSEHPGGGYGVWSLEDIYIRTRFGPYKGNLLTSFNKRLCKGFQWKVEIKKMMIVTLDGSERMESNWLRFVNYARNKKEQNLIAIQCHSEVYFVTSKVIPANTQLFVWYKDRFFEKRSKRKKDMPIKHSIDETEDKTSLSSKERSTEYKAKKTIQHCQTTHFLIQPTAPPMTYNPDLTIVKPANVPLFNRQSDSIINAESNVSTQQANGASSKKSQNDNVIFPMPNISTQPGKIKITIPSCNGQKIKLYFGKPKDSTQPTNSVSFPHSQNDDLIITKQKMSTESANVAPSCDRQNEKLVITNPITCLQPTRYVSLLKSQNGKSVITKIKSEVSTQPVNSVSLVSNQNDQLLTTEPKVFTQPTNGIFLFNSQNVKLLTTESKVFTQPTNGVFLLNSQNDKLLTTVSNVFTQPTHFFLINSQNDNLLTTQPKVFIQPTNSVLFTQQLK